MKRISPQAKCSDRLHPIQKELMRVERTIRSTGNKERAVSVGPS